MTYMHRLTKPTAFSIIIIPPYSVLKLHAKHVVCAVSCGPFSSSVMLDIAISILHTGKLRLRAIAQSHTSKRVRAKIHLQVSILPKVMRHLGKPKLFHGFLVFLE